MPKITLLKVVNGLDIKKYPRSRNYNGPMYSVWDGNKMLGQFRRLFHAEMYAHNHRR